MAFVNDLFEKTTPQTYGTQGGLASIYKPIGGSKYIDVVKDYPWTLSENVKTTAPTVILKEYQLNETSIRRQFLFYSTALGNFNSSLGNTPPLPSESTSTILQPYEELYPKNDTTTTGFVYYLPYFSDINFEVKSPEWATLDGLEQAQKAAVGTAGFAAGQKFAGVVEQLANLASGAVMAGASLLYPKVGIMDRPRIWQSHEFRTIDIKFPLFNTLAPDDWKKNRLLCELLVNQNLYNKRDFITSIPPVFYEVLVLGQHYSYAACVTNITIYNRGNMRQINEAIPSTDLNNTRGELINTFNIPDVYEINITLTDMVMPSKNQFQSIQNPKVLASISTSQFSNTPTDTGFTQNTQDVIATGITTPIEAAQTASNIFNNINNTF